LHRCPGRARCALGLRLEAVVPTSFVVVRVVVILRRANLRPFIGHG
jgi:hypothetical protein